VQHYQSPATGNEISTVFYGVPEHILLDPDFIEKSLLDALAVDNFTIMGAMPHHFEPSGYTTLILLAESHAAIHTYPEHKSLYFSLYSCRGEQDGNAAFEYFKTQIPHESIKIINNKIVVNKEAALAAVH
jgi:S-adenosylmethionine decarboxylase proenzyme